jgi:hypothetical protein
VCIETASDSADVLIEGSSISAAIVLEKERRGM